MLNKVIYGGPSTRLYHFLVTPQSLASSMVIMKKRKVWLRAVSWIIKLMGVYAEGFVFGKWYGAKPLLHDYVLKAVYKDAFNLLCSNFLSSCKPLKSFGVKLGIVYLMHPPCRLHCIFQESFIFCMDQIHRVPSCVGGKLPPASSLAIAMFSLWILKFQRQIKASTWN